MSLPLSLFLCCSLRHDMIPCQIVGNDINLPRLHPFSWGLLESWLTSSEWADAHAAHTHTHTTSLISSSKKGCSVTGVITYKNSCCLLTQVSDFKSEKCWPRTQFPGWFHDCSWFLQHRSGSNGRNVMWHQSSVYRFWAAKAESLRETKISHTRHANRSTK